MSSAAGLYVSGNSTPFVATSTAAKYTTGLKPFNLNRGDNTIREDVATSKSLPNSADVLESYTPASSSPTNGLVVQPGVYKVNFNASVVCDEELVFTLRKGANAVNGGKAIYPNTWEGGSSAEAVRNVSFTALVEVLAADIVAAAGGCVLSLYVAAPLAGGNVNVLVEEMQLVASLVH